MKIDSNRLPTNGVLCLEDGTEIKLSNLNLDMAISSDSPTELSIQGYLVGPIEKAKLKKEDEKMNKKYYSVTVTFDTGSKGYEYLIHEDAVSFLNIGEKYKILNEAGYDYRNTSVTVQYFSEYPTLAATRKIIALQNCSRGGIWIDSEFICNDECRQTLIDQWIEKTDTEISFKKEYQSFFLPENSGNALKTIVNRFNESTQNSNVNFNKSTNNFKGEDKMNIFGNIEFGKVNHRNTYAMTLKGLAYLRNDGTSEKQKIAYVQYDPKTESIEDVTPFVLDNMDSRDFVYKMPVATSAVKKGDIILDCSNPVFVKEVKDSTLTVVDPYSCEVKTILAAKNVFGFNFVTKIVNLMDSFNIANSANAENPFGNILPLMLLSKDSDMNDMLPLLLMSNGNFKSEDLMSNPMMMYFLMKDGKSNDMLPLLLMSNSGLFSAPAKEVSNEEV